LINNKLKEIEKDFTEYEKDWSTCKNHKIR
jgi:hypothetical protein